jgi:hypothetical protein
MSVILTGSPSFILTWRKTCQSRDVQPSPGYPSKCDSLAVAATSGLYILRGCTRQNETIAV